MTPTPPEQTTDAAELVARLEIDLAKTPMEIDTDDLLALLAAVETLTAKLSASEAKCRELAQAWGTQPENATIAKLNAEVARLRQQRYGYKFGRENGRE